MVAVKGKVLGNTITIEDRNIDLYDGMEAIVTILDFPIGIERKKINWDEYNSYTERGQDPDNYVKELRNNDRL